MTYKKILHQSQKKSIGAIQSHVFAGKQNNRMQQRVWYFLQSAAEQKIGCCNMAREAKQHISWFMLNLDSAYLVY